MSESTSWDPARTAQHLAAVAEAARSAAAVDVLAPGLREAMARVASELPRLARIVEAAAAFRFAAAATTWPAGPWREMAEICAAVDGVPGPDDEAQADDAPRPRPGPALGAPPSTGTQWHYIPADGPAPQCGNLRLPLLMSRAVPAEQVPAELRCCQPACGSRWPRLPDDQVAEVDTAPAVSGRRAYHALVVPPPRDRDASLCRIAYLDSSRKVKAADIPPTAALCLHPACVRQWIRAGVNDRVRR